MIQEEEGLVGMLITHQKGVFESREGLQIRVELYQRGQGRVRIKMESIQVELVVDRQLPKP